MDNHPKFDLDMRITWGDCDAAGISYYARTFDWFTNGRLRLLEAYGFPYMETFHDKGIALVCLSADCRYKKILRPEETVVLRTVLSSFTRSRSSFDYQILKKNGELAAVGNTSHAFVDKDGNPFNLKKRFPELWQELTDKWPVFQDGET